MPTWRWPAPDRPLAAAKTCSDRPTGDCLTSCCTEAAMPAKHAAAWTAKTTRSSRDVGVILCPTRTGIGLQRSQAATGETSYAFSRGERTYHSGRPGHTNGRHPAALLAAGLAVARDSGAGLSTGAGAPAGRGPGRLPRHQRAHRADSGIMPASPRFTVFRPQRGVRPALRLSRLEIRRRWQLRRHDE